MSRLDAALRELADALLEELRAGGVAANAPEMLMSIDDASYFTGLGRTALKRELAAGRIRAMTTGRRTRVPYSAVVAYIDARSAEALVPR